jgi:hypothetical protein
VRAQWVLCLAVALGSAAPAIAQTPTPAPTAAPPAAAHSSIKVDGALFADVSYIHTPKIQDATGRSVSLSQFAISRAYMTIAATLAPRISARITADVTRETSPTSALNGTFVFRIKYAFMNIDLDHLGPRAWVRFGIQHTPYIDAVESVYRYRFQGTLFTERDAGMSGADAGVTMHVDLPHGYGDAHGGLFNGEGYRNAETNNQKSLQGRLTIHPFPTQALMKGLSVQLFGNADHYVHDAPRQRVLISSYFQHPHFNAGFDVLRAIDQPLPDARRVEGHGFQFYVTPFFRQKGHGPEALLRFDRFQIDLASAAVRHRLIVGAAYWFPREGTDYAAIMIDFEQLTTVNAVPAFEPQRRLAIHGVVHF